MITAAKSKHLALMLVVALSLGGCTVRVAYHFLDTALLWGLNDYIELDKEQKSYAKALIKDFHEWHRYTQLPDYAVTLKRMADELDAYISVETIDQYAEAFTDTWLAFMEEASLPASQLLARLSDAQVTDLLNTLEEEEREDRQDYLKETPEETQQERYRFMAKGAERLMGKLTADQEVLIKSWAADLQDMGEMSLEHRATWREQFADALQNRSDSKTLELELRQLWGDSLQDRNPQYQERVNYNERLTHQLLADLANSMTTKQRQRTTKRLRSLAVDFESLSASPPDRYRPKSQQAAI